MKSVDTKILITGASGNLGRALINYLSIKGYSNITAAYHNTDKKLSNLPGITWQKLDILDCIALEDIMQENEIVIHLAGMVSYQPKDKPNILKINIEGTANVVNMANACSIKKLIHISSTAALGIPTEPRVQDESYIPDPTQFITDYALSKWYGELEVWRAISEGLNAIILAPSIIINTEDPNANTNIFKEKIKKGISYFPIGNSGFVDAADVVKAIVLLLEEEIQEDKLILNAVNLSWSTFFSKVAKNLSIKCELKPATSFYITYLSIKNHISTIFGKPISVPTSMAKHMGHPFEYNGQKVTEVLNFQYTPIDETLTEYCRF